MTRLGISLALLLGLAISSFPAKSDHVFSVIVGGLAGGILGSQVGGGSGRDVAIGLGAALGALHGRTISRHRFHMDSGPEVIYQSHSPVIAYEERRHYRPRTQYIVRPEPSPVTVCRVLEHNSISPVYGCRDLNGNWRIVR